ncbi:pyrroline-5-carboxylate reductase [Sphingomonas sp. LaA6.9]|uniref:pyrroline-5-carboxylate reductase family protein n=1 Tax=Sphingomonas sp. LaA6.9 TaxID=2919914 RepID=UPI001F501BF7|nr:pyrroline-5-carboxylate reductase [Sphingomonas sp. LaA6.9]MCJ8158597.1 pyrroline-5-carboxylate reductase [Sphingomonas sp. LaA6.9]
MTYPFDASRPLWLIGCGNMAGAMLSRWLETGLDPAAVTIVDPHRAEAPAGIRLLAAPPTGEAPPAALLLGTKPQTFPAIAPQLAALTGPQTMVVSIMAGVDAATLSQAFPDAGGVVRLMPNLPVALGKGVALLFGPVKARVRVDALAAPLGLALWVDDEALIDAGTAVSGSGPAFVYRFIDAMAAGAARLGFSSEDAARLALATVEGATALAVRSNESPAVLADRVASPRGTTRAGLDVLDAEAAIFDLVHRTLKAAADRAVELAAEARKG